MNPRSIATVVCCCGLVGSAATIAIGAKKAKSYDLAHVNPEPKANLTATGVSAALWVGALVGGPVAVIWSWDKNHSYPMAIGSGIFWPFYIPYRIVKD